MVTDGDNLRKQLKFYAIYLYSVFLDLRQNAFFFLKLHVTLNMKIDYQPQHYPTLSIHF